MMFFTKIKRPMIVTFHPIYSNWRCTKDISRKKKELYRMYKKKLLRERL